MAELSSITEADILREVVSPGTASLNDEAARSLLALGFSESAAERMRWLLDKNNKGELASAEAEELDKYRRVGLFLDLVQAKARISLADSQG